MPAIDRHGQRGLTLIGLLIFLFILGLGVYFVARLLPDYMDYWAVKRIVAQLQTQAETESLTDMEIRGRFDKQLNVDYVKTVSGRDLIIDRDRRAGVRVSIEWNVKKPFIGNISLWVDFKAGEPPAE